MINNSIKTTHFKALFPTTKAKAKAFIGHGIPSPTFKKFDYV
jgi:hypothetical protein